MNAARGLAIASACQLLLLLAPRSARAESGVHTPPAAEQAQQLFERAVNAMEHGDFATACPALEDSQRLDPAGGTLLNLAYCWEKREQWAAAARTYRSALQRAKTDQRAEREELARAGLERVMPNVARLRLVVPQSVARLAALQVWLDSERVSAEELTFPQLVDPGAHRIRVRAANREVADFTAATPEAIEYTVNVPEVPTAGPPNAPGPQRAATLPPPTSHRRTAFWVTAASATALFGVGAAAGVLAGEKHAESNRNCMPCTMAGVNAEQSANRYAWVANIGIGAGVVAAGAAIYLILTESPQEKRSAQLEVLEPG